MAWPWVLLVLGVVAGVVLVLWLRRRRYLAQVRALGWSHTSSPTLADVADLQLPPFGLGFDRDVDELLSGTTAGGSAFRVFDYDYRGAGPRYAARVACLQLPFGLPEAYLVEPGRARPGIGMGGGSLVAGADQGIEVIAADDGLVGALLASAGPAVAAFHRDTGTVDLGIDGNHLVASGAPKDPVRLAAFLGSLDPVARAVADSADLAARQRRPAPAGWHYGHPDWSYIGVDDGVLDRYPVTRGGYGHRTEHVVRGLRDGIGLDAFVHHWKTDRTETYTDGEGHTRTRTVTDHHCEPVCGFVLPFALPALSVNGRRVGRKVAFESSDFNDAFTVRTDDPRFASDVLHPRTMEWLLAVRPQGWTLDADVVVFEVEEHDLLIVDACTEALRGWLGRIPRFVWADRGLPPPAYLVE